MTTTVGTVDLSGIITMGKTREILSFAATAAGEKSVRFTSEAEALKFSMNITEKNGSKIYWEVYEEPGDASGGEVLIYQSPTNGAEGVVTETVAATGKIRVDMYFTDAITLELSAIGVPALMANRSIPTTVELTAEEKMYRQGVLNCLSAIQDTLECILNHQRQITNLESDKGNKY